MVLSIPMKFNIFIFLFMMLNIVGCGTNDNTNTDIHPNEETVDYHRKLYNKPCKQLEGVDATMFHNILSDLCSQELWRARDCYDACSWMIVPMHYAFKSGDDYAVSEFAQMFNRFANTCQSDGWYVESRAHRLQWLYLCSQYLALTSSFNTYKKFFIPALLNVCIEEAGNNLYRTHATWKTEATVEEHIKQVLVGKHYKYHYYSSLTDGDMFSLAILSDVVYASKKNNIPVTDEMSNAVNLSYEIFNSPLLNTDLEDGGWLFQVGVAQDYKDYIYAGNTEITEDMQPNPREDIVSDVSHFRRMAFFFNSYESAQDSLSGGG